jgi:hypothetical protein
MTVARFAISMDAKLARDVRKAAGATPMSSWLADAAQRKLRAEGLLRAVTEWENKHGEISKTELAAAARNKGASALRDRFVRSPCQTRGRAVRQSRDRRRLRCARCIGRDHR